MFKIKLFSIILFATIFISNAQDKCKNDYTCRYSPYCGEEEEDEEENEEEEVDEEWWW